MFIVAAIKYQTENNLILFDSYKQQKNYHYYYEWFLFLLQITNNNNEIKCNKNI